MLGIPFKYNLRNLAVRRVATVMTMLGIALPTSVFCAVLALKNGLDTALKQTGDPQNVVFLRKSSLSETNSSVARDDAPVIEALEAVARDPEGGAAVASREVMVLLNLPRVGGAGTSNVAIRGTTPMGRAMRAEVKLVEGRWPGEGLTEVAVARRIAERFQNCALGSRLPLGKRDWRVVGIFDAGTTAYGSEIWGDAQTLAGAFLREAWNAVWVRAKPGRAVRATELVPDETERKELNLAEDSLVDESGLALLRGPKNESRLKTLSAMTERDYFRKQTELGSPIAGIGTFIAFFMAIGAAFAVMNTMYAAIANRGREIAVMRAIGFPRRSILASFLAESIFLAFLGGLVGALGSFLVNGISTGTTNFATFSEITFAFRVNAQVLAQGFAFGAILGVIGGLFPAIRAARQPIVAAMRAI